MREYLFRGKRVDNGEWVEGFLCLKNIIKITRKCFDWRGDYVCDSVEEHKVDSETVGQYTGLKDKNGKKVFEGDIIEEVRYCPFTKKVITTKKYPILYVEEEGAFCFNEGRFIIPICDSEYGLYVVDGVFKEFEVIGNIHDNKELLGELI